MAETLGIGSHWVNKKSWDSRFDEGERFIALAMSQYSKSRMKVLSCRLLQCLGSVNTLTSKGCSETRYAMHSSNLRIRSETFRKYLGSEAQLFVQTA